MLTRKRQYNKPIGFKKAKKFIIVTEGHRENKYFEKFNSYESRISVLLVEMEEDESAPSHFVKRLNKAQEDEEYQPKLEDEVWFVCDNDRGWREHIEQLKTICEQQTNWNIAVSNPCFEVWLHFHSGPIDETLSSCQELKTSLPKTALGSFVPETKLYKLAENMLEIIIPK